jgi:hypothetical protein
MTPTTVQALYFVYQESLIYEQSNELSSIVNADLAAEVIKVCQSQSNRNEETDSGEIDSECTLQRREDSISTAQGSRAAIQQAIDWLSSQIE